MAHRAEDLLSYRRLLKSRTRWRMIAIIAIVIALIIIPLSFSGNSSVGEEHIARIRIDTVISTDDARSEMLQDLALDDQVKAVFVRINSPGGTTAGSEALFHNLRKISDQKPVIAIIDELCASGGYIAALGADYIIARETSIVGSIGVLIQWGEIGELLNTVGVKINTIKSDPRKAEPDISKPLSPEGEAVLKQIVSDSHEWFLGLLSDRRSLSTAVARQLGDGRVFSGKKAVDLNLADIIGGEERAIDYLKENHEFDDMEIVNYEPHKPTPFEEFLSGESIIGRFVQSVTGVRVSSDPPLEGVLALWHPTL